MIVRGIPRGSLEQVIFRVDALHALVARGVTVVNGPRAIERTIDKFLASALLARAGVPTPRTIACERADDALEAFDELGGDVIVKPLFGSMGAGMTRVDDARRRVPRLPRAGARARRLLPAGGAAADGRDLRAFVVGGRVLAAIERVGPGWRENVARGASARAAELSAEQERVCVEAAEALGVDYAGVDLLGRGDYVLELNGIPGWHGLQEATGADVAAALVAHIEAVVSEARQLARPMTPLCSAVATSAPAAPAAASARRSSASRTPPPASSSRSGKAAWSAAIARRPAPRRCRRVPGRARSPRAVRRGAGARRRRAPAGPRAAGRARACGRRAGRRSGPALGSREQPVERVRVGQRLGPDDDAVRAEVQQRPRPLRLADARRRP